MIANRNGMPWTPRDVRLMRKLARAKVRGRKAFSAREAAAMLGRTVGATKYAAMIRGVHFRAINQKPGTQRRPEQRARLSRLATARHRARRRAARR